MAASFCLGSNGALTSSFATIDVAQVIGLRLKLVCNPSQSRRVLWLFRRRDSKFGSGFP